MDSRPPPPPHGTGRSSNNTGNTNNNHTRAGGLPPGNYDIFIVPPHSAGSGFLYLPSLKPHRNSFLAGVACAGLVFALGLVIVPMVRQWTSAVVASGGVGVLLLVFGVGVVGWAYGKTQLENSESTAAGRGAASGGPRAPPGGFGSTPFGTDGASSPRPNWQRSNPGAASGWEKAREETRKREEERRKKEDAEKERLRQREREIKERIAREKAAQERQQKEKDGKTKADGGRPGTGNYQKATAQSYKGDDEEHSFRPYDGPKRPGKHGSHSSMHSDYSWAQSQSTARTTPPPSQQGPYSNKDPDKIIIKAVYLFNDQFQKPVAQLINGSGKITDGLVLKMTTEGLFIDDDKRGVPQREWDVKAWTMKLVERFVDGKCRSGKKNLAAADIDRIVEDFERCCKSSCASHYKPTTSDVSSTLQSGELKGKHVLRASVRDADNKKYVFIIDEAEAWKVAVGLQRLRRGTQVRSLGVSGIPVNETKAILSSLGWL